MYIEIITKALEVITPENNVNVINEELSQALTDEGYPHILCLGMLQTPSLYEAVIMDGLNMNAGPIVQFQYDFQDRELQIL